MKNSMTISHSTQTIIITKAFEKKASIYKSPEYKELLEVQRDFPTYKVVVNQVEKKTSRTNKITLADIRRYIEKHDDENKSGMAKFEEMCNAKANGEVLSKSFFEIKKWFFENYPQAV